jgi:hypothetical protein
MRISNIVKLKHLAVLVQLLVIVTITSFSVLGLPATARSQSNQDINQPAMLIAPNPEFQIDVYPKPGTEKRRIGYGMSGDGVTVIEQVGSNEGYMWDYVRFDRPPHLEGWIREEFVAWQENDRAHQLFPTQASNRDRQQSSPRSSNQDAEGWQRSSPETSYGNQRS